ncbi:MAG: LysM peptidoglycan-binding domain-containing protein [Phycisphaerales bacterium]|nr:MAG: LysM peptidoglycan-binding domain-containing protein [Phycisphaerales bacterium]
MPLPSQSARPKERSNHMYRKSGSKRLPLLVVCVLALLTIGVWWILRDGGSETPAEEAAPVAAAKPDALRDEPGARRPSSSNNASDAALQIADATSANTAPQIQMGGSNRSDGTRLESNRPGRTNNSTGKSSDDAEEPLRPAPSTDVETVGSGRSSTGTSSNSTRTQPANDRPSETAARRRALDRMESGMARADANEPVEARRLLTLAYDSGELSRSEMRTVRQKLTQLNERLVFSPEIVQGDPFSFGYTVRSGDSLARLTTRQGAQVDWRLIQRINRVSRPERIYPGQQLKLISGPFHAVVHKSEYRLDLYLGDGSERVFVRSFPVGLGEFDSTPIGRFKVRTNSKLINPAWTNPRTREYFSPDNPENPIGNHWIGLKGIDEHLADVDGYGIHGTIEPDSIGQQRSMGCIRLHNEDVELIYELLVEERSTVTVLE